MERAELRRVLRKTKCAVRRGGFEFLCDPTWGAREKAQFEELAKDADTTRRVGKGWLCIPTGGTSAKLKFARHDEHTISAAVDGFCSHFELSRVNAVDVLAPFHVSSFMARVRCAATGGIHLPWAWKDLERGEFPEISRTEAGVDGWVLSLVPTQLHRLLGGGERALIWLHKFQVIFLGGAPVWPSLADAAARARLPVVLSYGMTETAAMVASQRPDEFAAGDRSSGKIMPHALVQIKDASTENGSRSTVEVGVVQVGGGSLFRGYFPGLRDDEYFDTGDLGYWGRHRGLNIIGRSDSVIISGGKKVFPGEVESVLRATGIFEDVVVLGAPDQEWGESVVAFYPGKPGGRIDMERVDRALATLSKYKHPKRYIAVEKWPVNAQRKVSRTALRGMLPET